MRWLDDTTTWHEVQGRPFVVRSTESSADEFDVYDADDDWVLSYVNGLDGVRTDAATRPLPHGENVRLVAMAAVALFERLLHHERELAAVERED